VTAPPEKPRQVSDDAAVLRVAEISRVLVGDGRPANPVAAATLFRGAVNQGNGAAAERLAALAARGLNRDANWTEAVGWLVKAADLGNAAARGQILALLGVDAAPPGATWLELGRQIDLTGLLGAPSLTRLREFPAIALIEGLATPGMCRWLMGRGAERLTGGLGLRDMDVVSLLAQKRLELASGLKVIQQEPPRLLSYGVGEADDECVDFPVSSGLGGDARIATKGQRVATCLTSLNDEFEGGETAFPRIDWRYTARAGDSLLFLNVRSSDREPDPLSLHEDVPVTEGRKWVLYQSVRDGAQPIA
jgi:prolyl 4-hydroxylase